MNQLVFNRDYDALYGEVVQVAPMIRRVLASNPSPFTFYGTGTYIIGQGNVAVVDPGPADSSHVDALLTGLEDEVITHILITHTHLDHSPACRLLQNHTDAPSYAFGPHGAGNVKDGDKVEEGADWEFEPDVKIGNGEVIQGAGWSVECVYTPGHTFNHMCYRLGGQKALFCGDHVMAWSTSIIAPPDGDLSAYMKSLELLLRCDDKTYWPTHGPPINNPKPFVRAYIEHRKQRMDEVLNCLGKSINTIPEMVKRMYRDLPESMHPAAARSVFATVLYLIDQNKIHCEGAPGIKSCYSIS